MTNIEKIVKEFFDSADTDGVPNLSTHKWKELNSDYTKQEIKEGLALYIINHKPKFPFRKIELSTVKNKFASLSTEDLSHYIITPDKDKVLEKYNDYKYPYSTHGLFLIDNGHYYNDISNYDDDDDDNKVHIMLKLMFKCLHVCVRDLVFIIIIIII